MSSKHPMQPAKDTSLKPSSSNLTDLKMIFADDNLVPYEHISRYGIKNASGLQHYLNSPEGNLLKGAIATRMNLKIALEKENAFEETENLLARRRMLVLLIVRYIAKKAKEGHPNDALEKFLKEMDEEEAVKAIEDAERGYNQVIASLNNDISYLNQSTEELQRELKQAEEFEKQLDDFLAAINNAEENTYDIGEKFAEFFMAISQQFTEQIEASDKEIEEQQTLLQQQSNKNNSPPSPKPQAQNSSEKKKMHFSDMLHRVKQLQDQTLNPQSQAKPSIIPKDTGEQLKQVIQTYKQVLQEQRLQLESQSPKIQKTQQMISSEREDVLTQYRRVLNKKMDSPTPSPSPTPYSINPKIRG